MLDLKRRSKARIGEDAAETATHRAAGMARLMARSERGSITIQVVIMSLLLFGALGLVIDSGRVYATHSQMQAYADQVALAAANELDGKDDSIYRATQAAFGLAVGDEGFLTGKTSGGADIWIKELIVWRDLRENFGRQDDLSNSTASSGFTYVEQDDGTFTREASSGNLVIFASSGVDNTAAAEVQKLAKYVTVVVNRHTQLTLGDFFNSVRNALKGAADRDAAGAKIAANATAGLERVSCDRLSSLVFCNPWEDSGTDLESIPDEDLVGRSLMYFAPNFDGTPTRGPISNGTAHGSHFRWSEPNQLYTLSDPIRDDVGVCDLQFLQSYFTLTGEDVGDTGAPDYMEVRDRCLLARAQTEQICYENNTIGIRPAHGPTVLSAINVAFDIYNEPMDQVIAATDVISSASTDSLDLTLGNFFEPDAVVTHSFERMIDVNNQDTSTPEDMIPDTGIDGAITQDDYLAHMDGLRVDNPETTATTEPEVHVDPSSGFDFNSIYSLRYGSSPAPLTRLLQDGVRDWGMHDCHRGTETQEQNFSQNLAQAIAEAEATGVEVDPAAIEAASAVGNACSLDFVGDKNANPFDFAFGSPDFFSAVGEYEKFATQVRNFYDVSTSISIPIGVERPWYDFYVYERTQMSSVDGSISGSSVLGDGPSDSYSISDWHDLDYTSSVPGSPVFNTTNDTNQLKNSPLDPNLDHQYPSIGVAATTHAMESFRSRTGRTSLTAGFDFERRKIKAAFVNCRASTLEPPSGDDGLYQAQIVDTLDVFLSRPAEQYCGLDPLPRVVNPGTPAQTISTMSCAIQDQVETRLFVETIGRAAAQPLDLFTAQLVR